MDLLKKIQRRGTGYVVETDLERAYEEKLIEQFKVQLYTLEEEGKELTVYKLMVELKGDNDWFTLSSRRLPNQARDFRDFNTIIKHIQNRYPETENVQINLKPEIKKN